MNKFQNIITCLLLACFINTVTASENKESEPKAQLRGPAEFQKVIDDYKAYVATIPPEVRDEIIAFRKSVAQLNKEKSLLYKKLSQSSQDYLKKEQQYKKKLPLNRKNLIKLDNPKAKPLTNDTKK